MKRIITLIVALAVLAIPVAAQIKITDNEAQKLYITVNTVGTAQTLDHKNVFGANGAPLAKVEPGFQTAFGDLGFIGKFGKKQEIEVVFDMYLSSRNHPSQTYRAKTNPEVKYEMTSASLTKVAGDAFVVRTTGKLTIAGTTRDVTMDVTATRVGDNRYLLTGEAPIRMPDYGIKPPTAMLGTIKTGPEVKVAFRWVVARG